MKIIEATYPHYLCEYKDQVFTINARWTGDGRLVLEPEVGWDQLTKLLNQDSESLYELIDDAIYNVTPEIFDRNN